MSGIRISSQRHMHSLAYRTESKRPELNLFEVCIQSLKCQRPPERSSTTLRSDRYIDNSNNRNNNDDDEDDGDADDDDYDA